MIYENVTTASLRTESVSNMEINLSRQFWGNDVFYRHYVKHIQALCWQNAEFRHVRASGKYS